MRDACVHTGNLESRIGDRLRHKAGARRVSEGGEAGERAACRLTIPQGWLLLV